MTSGPGRPARLERPPLPYAILQRWIVPAAISLASRTRFLGLENVPPTGPVVLASNHVDNLDAAVIGVRIPRVLRFMGRPEVFREAIRGTMWRWLGAISADGNGLAEAIHVLRSGGAVAIYPEGVISPALVPARAGLGILAMRAKAPIVPIAVWGTERVRLPWCLIRRPRVCVRYGRPIPAGEWHAGSGRAQALTDEVMRTIAAMLPPEYRGAYATAMTPPSDPAAGHRPPSGTVPEPIETRGANR